MMCDTVNMDPEPTRALCVCGIIMAHKHIRTKWANSVKKVDLHVKPAKMNIT